MKAIILCAGKGERLLPLTKKIPKPLVPIDGKPVLEYILRLCKKHGITQIGINTSYLPEKIRTYFGDGSGFGVQIRYSNESELLGTAGALNNFRDFLDDSFFVLYGDNVTDLDLSQMLEFHRKKGGIGTLYLYREPMVDEKTTPGCVVLGENDEIVQIIEKPTQEQQERLQRIPFQKRLTNAGIYLLEPSILDLIPAGFSDFPRDIFPSALKSEKLFGFQAPCYLREVGQFMRYEKAKEEIESGKIKLNL